MAKSERPAGKGDISFGEALKRSGFKPVPMTDAERKKLDRDFEEIPRRPFDPNNLTLFTPKPDSKLKPQ